jgi:hypothetical protein
VVAVGDEATVGVAAGDEACVDGVTAGDVAAVAAEEAVAVGRAAACTAAALLATLASTSRDRSIPVATAPVRPPDASLDCFLPEPAPDSLLEPTAARAPPEAM